MPPRIQRGTPSTSPSSNAASTDPDKSDAFEELSNLYSLATVLKDSRPDAPDYAKHVDELVRGAAALKAKLELDPVKNASKFFVVDELIRRAAALARNVQPASSGAPDQRLGDAGRDARQRLGAGNVAGSVSPMGARSAALQPHKNDPRVTKRAHRRTDALRAQLKKAHVKLHAVEHDEPRDGVTRSQRAIVGLANHGTTEQLTQAGFSWAAAQRIVAARARGSLALDDVLGLGNDVSAQFTGLVSRAQDVGASRTMAQAQEAHDLAAGVLGLVGVTLPDIVVVPNSDIAASDANGIYIGDQVVSSISVEGLAQMIGHEAGHVVEGDSAASAVVNGLVQANLLSQADADAFSRGQESVADLYAGLVAGVTDPNPDAPALGSWLQTNFPESDADHPASDDRADALAAVATTVSQALDATLADTDASGFDGGDADGVDGGGDADGVDGGGFDGGFDGGGFEGGFDGGGFEGGGFDGGGGDGGGD